MTQDEKERRRHDSIAVLLMLLFAFFKGCELYTAHTGNWFITF